MTNTNTRVYLSLYSHAGETRVSAVDFSDSRPRLNWTFQDGATFPATRDGFRLLGRFLAERWPARDVYSSSSLDFPHEYGLDLTSDEIFEAIEAGELEARPASSIDHLFH